MMAFFCQSSSQKSRGARASFSFSQLAVGFRCELDFKRVLAANLMATARPRLAVLHV